MSTSSPTINPQNLQSFNQPEFQDLVQQFLLAASYRGLSPQTLTYYSFHLLGLERFLISRQIPFLATNCVMVLQDWLQQLTKQGYAGRSIRGRFYTCRQFLRFAFPDTVGESFSVTMPSNSQVNPYEPICFTEADVERILHQPNLRRFTGLRDYTMMLLLLDTGIRLTELSALLISDLDFQDGFIHIARGKGNKSRFVPIQKTCAAALHTYLQLRGEKQHHALWISGRGQPLQQDTIKHLIIKHCRGAGVRGSAHAFRRTMAKSFLMNGGNAYALQALLGHSNITMTRQYVPLQPADVRHRHETCSPVESLLRYAQKCKEERKLSREQSR
ncbi:tyrosine-type recombinase/integrase [Cohnella massiliensis]|uniref:tyrosine-type recombinase/integrase n=1 Tax=Cohnella massiliensis TaxID=1816691 RepID=UPI0009BB341A|nr:tyrosine-type recombinase/integrase [Cohnella massiliensis]